MLLQVTYPSQVKPSILSAVLLTLWIVFQNVQLIYISTQDVSFLSDERVLQVVMHHSLIHDHKVHTEAPRMPLTSAQLKLH
jgi:hypothetical protein